jgi:hypothetical protein
MRKAPYKSHGNTSLPRSTIQASSIIASVAAEAEAAVQQTFDRRNEQPHVT